MKKKLTITKLFFTICIMTLAITCIPVSAHAATKKEKALKAYAKLLSGSKISWDTYGTKVNASNCYFTVAYIDKDSVPELILKNSIDVPHMAGYGAMYTYSNGKVKYVDRVLLDQNFYYYKKKGVYADSYLGFGYLTYHYTTLKNGKINRILATDLESVDRDGDGKLTTTYHKNLTDASYKKISKAEFNKILKKKVGSTKKTKAKFYKNTKSMRNKYL